MVSPHNTGQQRHSQATTQPRLIRHKSLFFFSFGGGALVKTKLTAGRLSPTIITSQHNITTFLRLHFQEGMKGGRGKEGRRDVTLGNNLGNVLGFSTHLKGGILQWQQPESVQCVCDYNCSMYVICVNLKCLVWFKNSYILNL